MVKFGCSVSLPSVRIGSSVARAARPDRLQAILSLDFGQLRVDRSGEARVVELDRDVVALGFAGLLLPTGAEFDVLRCTAKR